MAPKIGYRDRKQKRGLATNLEWFHAGRKWRPLLGYDLTDGEKALRATEAVNKILEAIKRGELDLGGSTNSRVLTLEQAAEKWLYPTLERLNRRDQKRPQQAMAHLTKFFPGPIDEISLESVHLYVAKRQAQKAAGGTIRREVGVLSRTLSLAQGHKAIQYNPCDEVELPEEAVRERIVKPDEIRIMQRESNRLATNRDLWRVIVSALTLGLRRSKILSIETRWLARDSAGQRWLHPEPGTSKLKRVPPKIALGKWSTWALLEAGVVPIKGKIYRRWAQSRAFSQSFERLIARCHKKHPSMFDDLHFHDFKHTFSSVLSGLGVPYLVIQYMSGHKVRDTTGRYLHETPEFLAQLVDASNRINAWLDEILSGKQAGASATPAVND